MKIEVYLDLGWFLVEFSGKMTEMGFWWMKDMVAMVKERLKATGQRLRQVETV